ncbi:MAG: helix-turn-helix transcriptional regulator [Dehalococcoidia bacterium]|nr:helix-turn-helix transcriptional regulator [Dehalococcoidia bacterium]
MSGEMFERLSPRERQVAALIARGFSTKEIAAGLDPPVSFETAKGYVSSLLHKLDSPNRTYRQHVPVLVRRPPK